MKKICSGRMLADTTPKKVLYTGGIVAMRGSEFQNSDYALEKGLALDVVAIDEKAGTVTVASPIDPDRALVIAAEAIELYNEALGMWQTIKTFFRKIGDWFKAIPSIFSKK